MPLAIRLLTNTLIGALIVVAVGWVMNLPERFDIAVVTQQVVAIALGLSVGVAFLTRPYGDRARPLDLVLALAGAGSWIWYAWNFNEWMLLLAYRTPDMWIPGVVAIVLMVEALRKVGGSIIAGLVLTFIVYAFVGDHLPGVFEAEVSVPAKTVLYLYADSSGIPGLVLKIIVGLVLPFVIFGKVMEMVGGMAFFSDLALTLLGRWRGGPAKGASVASAAFGMLSGSTVANILSTGIVTIPLMKKTGFKPEQAAAIEAVASNGGQIMPPVMGATAFIIAEFLQIPYAEVVLAALTPALLYYFVLFVKIDSIAQRNNIAGLSADEVPSLRDTLSGSWMFILPLFVLIYLLFFKGYDPGKSALMGAAALLVAYVVRCGFRPDLKVLLNAIKQSGVESVPVILIGAGAGAVIGVLNTTGLAFQLTLALSHIASAYGLFMMLFVTALVSIVLGMGMPTVAVYVVLVTVVAPTVINLGVDPLGAHLFLFYFGLMSMITPPIALGSIVAAQVAGANMWTTGYYGIRLGMSAYFLPFLWIYNPALLLDGTLLEIVIVLSNCFAAVSLLRISMLQSCIAAVPDWLSSLSLVIAAIAIGGATVWFGSNSMLALALSLVGVIPFLPAPFRGKPQKVL